MSHQLLVSLLAQCPTNAADVHGLPGGLVVFQILHVLADDPLQPHLALLFVAREGFVHAGVCRLLHVRLKRIVVPGLCQKGHRNGGKPDRKGLPVLGQHLAKFDGLHVEVQDGVPLVRRDAILRRLPFVEVFDRQREQLRLRFLVPGSCTTFEKAVCSWMTCGRGRSVTRNFLLRDFST